MMEKSVLHKNDVVITGIGLVTALGAGIEKNWHSLSTGAAPLLDSTRFAPYTVHPLPEIDWSTQISKRDQRQMGLWQCIGAYAAGLALDDARMKDKSELTSTMDMSVAAGIGERDIDVDEMILSQSPSSERVRQVLINEKLNSELRPTLFLAQLSNLLAGNISIIHKVTGSSRTFLGDEGAGISAIKTAAARIRAGQSTHALVGASYNCEHPDMLLNVQIAGHLMRDTWSSVWQRNDVDGGGVIPGSGGAFLVLESRAHAQARGAKIYAILEAVDADFGTNDLHKTRQRLDRLATSIGLTSVDCIVSGASGAKARTQIEKELLTSLLQHIPVRGVASVTGHLQEAQFPLAVALGALSIHFKQSIDQIDSRFESKMNIKPSRVGVLAMGACESEGAAILAAANGSDH